MILGKAAERHRVRHVHLFEKKLRFLKIILREIVVYHDVVAVGVGVLDFLEVRFKLFDIFLDFEGLELLVLADDAQRLGDHVSVERKNVIVLDKDIVFKNIRPVLGKVERRIVNIITKGATERG